MSEHGTYLRYNTAGCRCDPCRAATAKHARDYREKRRKEKARLIALAMDLEPPAPAPKVSDKFREQFEDERRKPRPASDEGWRGRLIRAYQDGVEMADLVERFGDERKIHRVLRAAGVRRRVAAAARKESHAS